MDLALFDFDGTITTREMLPDFFRYVLSKPRLILGQSLLTPFIVGYKSGLVSGHLLRAAMVRVGLTGMAISHYRQCGESFASSVLPTVVRPEMLQRIAWHKSRGDQIVVVSGAFDVYLSHWCAAQGVDLICSSLQVHNDRLTGRYSGAQCVKMEKARRVKEKYPLSKFSAVYAYGDTPEDAELLNLAQYKYYRGALQ